MAIIAQLKTIPASKWIWDQSPVEARDGVRKTFSFVDYFDLVLGGQPKVFIGLQKITPFDFVVLESGGAGTGFNTIQLTFAPSAGDSFHVDFIKV